MDKTASRYNHSVQVGVAADFFMTHVELSPERQAQLDAIAADAPRKIERLDAMTKKYTRREAARANRSLEEILANLNPRNKKSMRKPSFLQVVK